MMELPYHSDYDSPPNPDQILSSLPVLVWAAHSEGTAFYLSALWCDYTGMPGSELLGKGWLGRVHSDDCARFLDALKAVGSEQISSVDFRLRRRDGEWHWFRGQATPMRDSDGRFLYWSGFCVDLSGYQQIEIELRKIQTDLNRAQAVTQTGSWRWDIQINDLQWSDEAYRIFGRIPRTPLTFDIFLSCVHPDDRDYVSRKWAGALQGESPYDIEHRIVVNGSVKWVRERAELEFDEHNAIRGGFGTVQDITERKLWEQALQESETRLKLAQQAGRIGIFDWDFRADKHFLSEEAQAIFGIHIAEVPTSFIIDHFHPDDRSGLVVALDRRYSDRLTNIQNEFRIIRADGEVRWIHSGCLVTADATGMPVRIIGSLLDITDRKRTEEALREAGRRKDEFLAMLAHELRNPLAPIRNAIYLLRKSEDPLVQRHRDMIDRQILHMTRLLDDLLDVSRMTRGLNTLHRQPASLSLIVSHALEIAQPLLMVRRHTLHTDLLEDLTINADHDRMVQVVDNLLTNAANYTPEGGEIWLSACRESQTAVIRVRDNGIGIDSATLPHVFELFTQASRSLDRSQGGLGIGLTIVQTLVNQHGGSVEARSEGLGRGSEFVVRLPLLPTATVPGRHAAGEAKPAAPSRKILVVEDVQDTAASLAEILKEWGHVVQVAYDGEQALHAFAGFRPDVILLDIGLPKMDGYEVAQRVRQLLGSDGVRIFSLTGYGQLQDRNRAQAAGINEQLLKPVDPEKLQQLLAVNA